MNKRKIAIYTGNRAEYSLLHPLIKALTSKKYFEVSLIITGSHLLEEFGKTSGEIDTSRVRKVKRIYIRRQAKERQIGLLKEFGELAYETGLALRELRPDIFVLAGDRYETFAAAIAAFYMNIPVAHIFGGDLSQGGHLDDSVRHSITKLAHIHFTSSDDSLERVLGLGEEKRRVFNVGSTAIDNAVSGDFALPEELARELKLDLSKPIVLFTQHPVTTESDLAYSQVKESLKALKELGLQTVITYPCNDAGGEMIIKAIREYSMCRNFRIRKSLGRRKYLGLMKIASCVAGNSSSGIIETPVFKVPSVNIGKRQEGRLRADNVIDVSYDKEAIKKAIRKAVFDIKFRKKAGSCANPYGDGHSAERISGKLRSIRIDRALLQKKMTF